MPRREMPRCECRAASAAPRVQPRSDEPYGRMWLGAAPGALARTHTRTGQGGQLQQLRG